ncbi:MAG: PAS domain S-box protein, partial [Candidatus Electryonea clarkiae]|nr:PAS domain S-box protein [Candidatus Electryonea clarkiae]
MARILVVDDEKSIRITLQAFLEDDGYDVQVAEDAITAVELLKNEDFDVVVTDIIMPKMTGVKLLESVLRINPHIQVIMMTGEPTLETASEALRFGAFDYLAKPITKIDIIKTVHNAASSKALHDEKLLLEKKNQNYRQNLEQLVEERTEELNISKQKFKDLSDLLPEMIYEMDLKGKITYVNKVTLTKTGYSKEDFNNGISVSQLLVPEDTERARKDISRIMKGENIRENEYSIMRKDGSIFSATVHSSPILQNNKPVGMRGIIVDISERKKAEEALLESEQILNETGQIAKIGGWEHDLATGKAVWTRALYDIVEIDYDDPVPGSEEHLNYYPPEYRKILKAAYERAIEKGISFDLDLQCNSSKGRQFWCRVNGEPVLEDGICTKMRGTFQDISDRKRAEAALQESSEILRAVFNSIPVRVFWKDKNLRYLGCNTAFAEDAGCEKPEDIIGKDDYEMNWREQADLYRADDLAVIESGETKLNFEEPQTTPSGEMIHLLTSKMPLRDDNRNITGVLGTYLDITELKQSENDLRESETRFKQITENAIQWVWEVDSNGLYTYSSPVVEQILGWKPTEIVGKKHFYDFFDPSKKDELKELALAAFREKKTILNLENSNMHRDGSIVFLETNCVPIVDQNNKMIGYRGIDTDITERKQMEEERDVQMAYLEELIEGAPEAIAILDNEDRVRKINREFTNIFEYKVEEAIGCKINDLIVPADLKKE